MPLTCPIARSPLSPPSAFSSSALSRVATEAISPSGHECAAFGPRGHPRRTSTAPPPDPECAAARILQPPSSALLRPRRFRRRATSAPPSAPEGTPVGPPLRRRRTRSAPPREDYSRRPGNPRGRRTRSAPPREDDYRPAPVKGRNGRAFLFSHAMNIAVGPKEDRQLMTGLHTIAGIYCRDCREVLGWNLEV